MKAKVTNNYIIFVGVFLMLFPCFIYGATLNVPSSQYPTVQSAVDAASPGDTIILQVGTTFTETVVLRYKPGADYITIQSSALSNLPTSGNRVNPANAQFMPKVTPQFSGSRAIETEITPNGPTHHYKLIGIEIGEFQTTRTIFDLIALGTPGTEQNSLDKVPHDFVIDRCYIHGNPNANVKNGIALNSADTEIINSYISEIHDSNVESHGIVGVNGIGRYQIINNYIGASSINILFGGAAPAIQNLVPTDILVKRNYLKKLDEWLAENPSNPGFSRWQIKNNFELKNARQVVIEDNIMDTNCGQIPRQGISCTTGGQSGSSVLFTVRNDDGIAPWSTIEDVTFRYNIIRKVPRGILTLGIDDLSPSQNLKNLNIENNLLLIDGVQYGSIGDCVTLVGSRNGIGTDNLTMNHNTCITLSGTSQYFIRGAEGTIINGWNLRNNIATPTNNESISHIYDEGSGNAGTLGLNGLAGNTWNMGRNILTFNSGYAYWVSQYPTNNFYTQNISNIGFVDAQNGNYQLSQTSPFKNQGTDNQDPGVNFTLLNQRTACTESGLNSCGGTQTPYPGPNAPTIPAMLEVENFDNGGEGVAYHEIFGNTDGGTYRPGEAVDIQARSTASNAQVVFETAADEWLEYTINVPFTRKYDIGVRYASEFNNGKFHIEIDGTDVTGQMTTNSTGNWGNFRVVTKRGVQLSAGTHVLRLALDANSPDGCGCIVANFDTILFKSALFDYDNDGRADISVFRPSNGTWYINRSSAGFTAVAYGLSTDIITPADFDGDGKTDVAVFRPSNGTWFILNSSNNTNTAVTFGQSGDIPVPADYDNDGKADIAVFRPSNGIWYFLNSGTNNSFSAVQFGISEDKPTIGDFDGDSKADIAVFRPSNGFWYRLNSGNGSFIATQFGISEDKPTPADYDGDGKADIAVFRPSNGIWYLLNSTTGFYGEAFGLTGDIPTPSTYVR